MPPKKRAKVSHVPSPSPASQPKTPASEERTQDDVDQRLLNDPWTDEEEIGLFKGLIKWKPTGIHKHFRLLALHQFMLGHGYIHPKSEHTTPAGIWRKLEQLYNLEALDERENARQLDKIEIPGEYRASRSGSEQEASEDDEDADAYSEAANKIENDDFDLAGAEFAELKWARRLAPKSRKDESPALLPDVNFAEVAPIRFTPSFSIEPSESATPVAKRGRGRAGTTTAASKQKPAAPPANKRRSARQAGSVADEEEDQGGAEQSEEEEDSEEEESEESTPAPRTARNAKGAKGRPAASNTKVRGRGRKAKGK